MAGTDDPIIPVANAHILNTFLPHSLLHLHCGGHIDLVHNATELAPVIQISERARRTTMSHNDTDDVDTSNFYSCERLLMGAYENALAYVATAVTRDSTIRRCQ